MEKVKRPTEVFAEQLARLRAEYGLSVRDVSRRMAELGVTMDASAITRIEKGERGVSFDDALAIAAALNVPPLLLFLPVGREDLVAVTPAIHIHPDLAMQWIAGEGPLSNSERVAIRVAEWHDRATPVRFHRWFRDTTESLREAGLEVRQAEHVGDEKQLQGARRREVEALQQLGRVVNAMVEADIRPPGLPKEWTQAMRRLGIEIEKVA